MPVLYIFLGIVFLAALILSFHIKIFIFLDDKFKIRVGFGPILITIPPKKREKKVKISDYTYKKHQRRLKRERKRAERAALRREKRKAKRAEKKTKTKKKQEVEKAKDTASATKELFAGDKLGAILDLVKLMLEEAGVFSSKIKTDVRKLHISVGGSDADKIARSYGTVSAILANLLELLRVKTNYKTPSPNAVSVNTDFVSPKTSYSLDLRFKLRLGSIILVGIHAAIRFFVLLVKFFAGNMLGSQN